MPYAIATAGNDDKWLFLNRLAYIADRAWRGYSHHGLIWRLNYYSQFGFGDISPDHLFRIVEHVDERADESHLNPEDCAFVTIFPLAQEFAELHQSGILSQYLFQPSHLHISKRRTEKSFHYVQSLFIDEGNRNSYWAKKLVRQSILALLKKQLCGYRGRAYRIYAETDLGPGKDLALKHGLIDANQRSSEGRPFSFFDSDVHQSSELGVEQQPSENLARFVTDLWT